jgi:4-amino-4-deoxy-L-arabinose transferase-like glycosyltransferase
MAVRTMARLGELFLLILVCVWVFFFWRVQPDFIKTEGLRAIVVHEMVETDQLTMPNVHHRPYLKKPPLYAWSTGLLALGIDRWDENVARMPSAISGLLFILLLYTIGEAWIGRGGGGIAAALGIANVTVIDYGMRAELDMGFTLWTTVAIVLVRPAMRTEAGRGWLAWLGCYGAATVAGLWKGPHSLIFLWLVLLAYGLLRKQWKWLRSPAQWLGLVIFLGAMMTWTVTLSKHAGAINVGKTAGIELFVRLVPHSVGDLISILTFGFVLVAITLPASLLILVTAREGQPQVAIASRGQPGSLRLFLPASLKRDDLRRYGKDVASGVRFWWDHVTADPVAEFLLMWIFSSFVFMTIVPAKSPRYTLPIFPPIFWLASYFVIRQRQGRLKEESTRAMERAWRGIYLVLGAIGGVVLILGAVLFFRSLSAQQENVSIPVWPFVVLGLGWLSVGMVEWGGGARRIPSVRWMGLLVVVACAKPTLSDVWWPLRTRSDTQRPLAQQIHDLIPVDQPVYVWGKHELPDLAYYCSGLGHAFFAIGELKDNAHEPVTRKGYILVPGEDWNECQRALGGDLVLVEEFVREDRHRPVKLGYFDRDVILPSPG